MNYVGKLLMGTAFAGLSAVVTPVAFAQDTATVEVSEDGDEQVVVTGSRIRRTGHDNPTPTTVLTSQTIEQSGVTEIADLVNEIPSLFISQSNQTSNNNGYAGLNALDLRGLGIQRTLVLVNGRRRVSAWPGISAVDVSALPTGLIERVEVITGGASALYGADAVAGVTNFMLKKDYTGLALTAQSGISSRGDLNNYYLDALYGTNFAGGRGNITVFGSYSSYPDEVQGQDRPWTAAGTPTYRRPTTGAPFEIHENTRNVYDYNGGAVVELGARGNLFSFTPEGVLKQIATPADIVNISSSTANISNYITTSDTFGGRYDDYLLTVPSERLSAYAALNYELTDNINAFVDVQYARTHSNAAYRAFSIYGLSGTEVPVNSPFITDEIRAANGGSIPATGLVFARRFHELGQQRNFYERSTVQTSVGLDGKLPGFINGNDWEWNASYTFGQTNQVSWTENGTAYYRMTYGLASAGTLANPVCADAYARSIGCVAINPLRELTQEMIDYVQYDTSPATQRLQQHVASAYLTGGLFDLPAGKVQVVLGAEYRKESDDQQVAAEYNPNSPLYDWTIGTTANPLKGSFEVKELFGELRVPLLKDVPLFHALTLETAVRLSDYSTAGRTDSWKIGGEWAPIPDLRFRSTYGQAVRAPNISELFTASSVSYTYLQDPCNYWDVVNRSNITEFTGANCAALSPANRNDPGSYYQWLPVTNQGNLDLNVETARTLTVGGVFRPSFLRNFSMSVDYFDIRLKDAISTFSAQTIAEKCVDAPTLNNIFCANVLRASGTNNLLGVITQNINLSQFRSRGVDIDVQYRQNLSDLGLGNKAGSLNISAAYTRLIERTFTMDPTDQTSKTETMGTYGAPKWKGAIRTTYTNGPASVNWSVRHYSGMRRSTAVTEATHVQVYTPDVLYHDLYVSIAAAKNFSLYGGSRNLFDKAPPRFPGAEAGGANFEYGTTSGLYDTIGRTLYIGARINF